MLTIRDCEKLRDRYAAGNESPLDDAGISAAELVDFAAAQMTNPDRNIRVLMLRLLSRQSGDMAMHAVLRGLRDESRRVCAVAIQACPNFMHYEAIVAQLVAIARDRKRKRKLRRRALSMLAGDEGRWRGDVTAAIEVALQSLMRESAYRFAVLFGLARLEPGERISKLLRQFAASSDSGEADMARRALDGEVVIHLDRYADDEAQRRRIVETGDLAHGRMYYWLPRESLK